MMMMLKRAVSTMCTAAVVYRNNGKTRTAKTFLLGIVVTIAPSPRLAHPAFISPAVVYYPSSGRRLHLTTTTTQQANNNNDDDDNVDVKESIPQPIVGFHLDEFDDWVAELQCGHYQHVRHNPPMTERPWVLTEEGRTKFIGYHLMCKKCCAQGAPRDDDDGK